jgi:hypothetical protein
MPGLGSVASSRPKNQAIQEGEWPGGSHGARRAAGAATNELEADDDRHDRGGAATLRSRVAREDLNTCSASPVFRGGDSSARWRRR